MAFPTLGLFLVVLVSLLPLITHVDCQTCKSQKFTNSGVFSDCLDLPSLSSYLHYSHDRSNSSISVAFEAPPPGSGGWIAWGVNLAGDGMARAESLVAYRGSNGVAVVKTYVLKSYTAIAESKLSFDVWDLSAESGEGVMKIFAKLKVPAKAESVNFIWQVGPSVTNGFIDQHESRNANLMAKGKLSLTGSGNGATTIVPVDSRTMNRNIHGILNAVSWGFLFPLGAMIARYARAFESADPAWFYAHISCQVSGYAIGVAGWATGLKLGSASKSLTYSNHRIIGIALFTIATLQIFALFMRPKKENKYRMLWNVYHHGLGYAIIVLGVLNVFKGLDILVPAKRFRNAYLVTIVALGGVSLLLEALTWTVVLRKKSRSSTKPFASSANDNGVSDSQRTPLSI